MPRNGKTVLAIVLALIVVGLVIATVFVLPGDSVSDSGSGNAETPLVRSSNN